MQTLNKYVSIICEHGLAIPLDIVCSIGYLNLEYKTVGRFKNVSAIIDAFDVEFPLDFIEYEPELFSGIHMEFNYNTHKRVKVIAYFSGNIRFITKIYDESILHTTIIPIVSFLNDHVFVDESV